MVIVTADSAVDGSAEPPSGSFLAGDDNAGPRTRGGIDTRSMDRHNVSDT